MPAAQVDPELDARICFRERTFAAKLHGGINLSAIDWGTIDWITGDAVQERVTAPAGHGIYTQAYLVNI